MIYFCADDYGVSDYANSRIENCLEKGVLNKGEEVLSEEVFGPVMTNEEALEELKNEQKDRIEFPILCPVPKHQYQSENKMIKKQLSENRYKNLTIQEAFP